MKKRIVLLCLMAIAFSVYSQTSPLKMMGFHKLPSETVEWKTLKESVGRDSDLDGNKAALLRIKSQGFDNKIMLDFTPIARPGIEIIHKQYQDGEMLLYVSSNCLGTLVIKYMGEMEFQLPQKLEAGGVYELILGMETATLVIRVIPEDATIYIDDEDVGIGYVSRDVSVGSEHRWKVQHPDYITKEGSKLFLEPDEEVLDIELDPNFGYITVTSNPMGADVYIDEQNVGTTPYSLKQISIGSHAVELRKYGYLSKGDIIVVTAGDHNEQLANVTLERDETIIIQQTVPVEINTTINKPAQSEQKPNNNNRIYNVNGVTFEMVEVKGGTFTMGSNAFKWEKPMHNVTVDDFYIGKYEVTQQLWVAVMGKNPSERNDDKLPVETVSWKDVQKFIKKLNEMTGENFRLPTEAEWEYAARGGSKSKGYAYSGSNNLNAVAWYNNGELKPHPVGQKAPNELGVYDMSGNVREWCQDWYGDYDGSNQTNPVGPASGSVRVLRGGCWWSFAQDCRVTNREYNGANFKSGEIGFRLVIGK